MLKRLLCDKFAPPYRDITFNEGLNVILGDSAGSSAIGKTAFLNVIDYVFGGDAYYSGDIQQNIGIHTIYFEFEFGEEHLYFYRNTGNTMSVFLCDDQWHYREEMELQHYRRLLAEKYGCLSGSYRFEEVLAHFFRIYGHGNALEAAPYRASIYEDDRKSIDFLMSIMGKSAVNAALSDKAKELGIRVNQLEKKVAEQGQEDEQQLEENREKIEHLTQRYNELMSENEDYQFGYLGFPGSADDPVRTKLNKLRDEVRRLTVTRDHYQSQIDAIKGVQDTEVVSLTSEFQRLQHFFPNANIAELKRVEHFHMRIREILQQEAQEQIDALQKVINRYDSEIEILRKRIQETGLTRKMAVAAMSQCVEIQMQIERLQADNKQIEENIQKREERLRAEQELAKLLRERKAVIDLLQEQINGRMRELYDTITGKKETSAPVLKINEDKSASFETPGNTSEGAAFKGLIIYDLAILSIREHCTPALIHDSNILSRIEADYLAPILRQYQKCGYQVFLSIDKPWETSDEAQKILFDHPLLQLAAGDKRELYGRSWSKLEQKKAASDDSDRPAEGEEENGKDS